MPHSFAPSAISHQPRSPPHFLFKTAAEVNGCSKATSTWDSSTQIVDNNLEHLILKQSLHPNLSPSQSSPYIFQRTPSQMRARLLPDTNASAPRFERVWELIRMRLPPDADVSRPAFAKKYRRRNEQKCLTPLSTGHLARKANINVSRNRQLAHFCNPFTKKTNSGDFPMQWLER